MSTNGTRLGVANPLQINPLRLSVPAAPAMQTLSDSLKFVVAQAPSLVPPFAEQGDLATEVTARPSRNRWREGDRI